MTGVTSGSTISAKDAIAALLAPNSKAGGIDVRSEGEFQQGAIPGFLLAPILNNEERHKVGICYKNEGSIAAVALGQRLVAHDRDRRIDVWESLLEKNELNFIACWRGGLRSSTAAEWLAARNKNVLRVEGGYKEMRRELLRVFPSLPKFLVICGATGSRKTKLLQSSSTPCLDLEKLACHRGSAFGEFIDKAQPSQATFENGMAFLIRKMSAGLLLVEDESRMIGRLCLPTILKDKMASAPGLRIQMSLEERVDNLVEEYISAPLQAGISIEDLQKYYERSISRITQKLGGLATVEIMARLRAAFSSGELEAHRLWIGDILTLYYDKAYEHSFRKQKREIVFEGTWSACQEWIQKFV